MSDRKPCPKSPGYRVAGKAIKQAGRVSDTEAMVSLEDGTTIVFKSKYVYDQMDGGEAVLVVNVYGGES